MVNFAFILSIILLILIIYKNNLSLWAIPLYSIIIDLISGFVLIGSKLGTIRAVTLLGAILFLIIRRYRLKSFNSGVIFLFIFYLALISQNSDNFSVTIYGVVTISIIFMSYLWGAKYLINPNAWKLYFKSLISVALLAIFYLTALQVFNIQTTVNMNYSELFNTGGLMASRMDTLAFISIFILYIVLNKREYLASNFKRYLAVILLSLIWIVILITLKRTTMLLVLIGVGLILYKHTQKAFLLKYGFILIIALAIMFYFFQDIIFDQFKVRSGKFQVEEISEEYRYKEAEILFNDMNKTYTKEQILFGKNLFYTKPFGLDKFGKERIIHSDITALVYGGGVIGVFLYFLIFLSIFIKFIKLRKKKYKLQESLFLPIFFMIVFVNIPGGFHDNITGSIIAMSILGGASSKNFIL